MNSLDSVFRKYPLFEQTGLEIKKEIAEVFGQSRNIV